MARELRKAARDSGEDVAAHHGLVKMIPQWERGGRVPRERYRLLYVKIFADTLGGLSQSMAAGTDLVLRLAEVRSRAARLPGPGEIKALESAVLAKPKDSTTPAEIRALAAEAIAHLHEVAGKLAELSALLGEDKPDGQDKLLGQVELDGQDKLLGQVELDGQDKSLEKVEPLGEDKP